MGFFTLLANHIRCTVCLSVGLGGLYLGVLAAEGQTVILHEIAWMGTADSPQEQWIELYNASDEYVSLADWTLMTASGSISNRLSGRLAPGQIYLLGPHQQRELAGIPVNSYLSGHLSPEGEELRLYNRAGRLVDRVNAWHAGCNESYATMQRVYPYTAGSHPDSWTQSTVRYDSGYGTPGFRHPPAYTEQELNQVFHGENTINVFFNQSALTEFAFPNNLANHRINLEERIIDRIRQARRGIDLALYEINLPAVVDALMERAAEGLPIRLLIDAKPEQDADRNERYRLMRVYLERMLRGLDGQLGTGDSIHIFANSPIFAVADPDYRAAFGLPRHPSDMPYKTLHIGNGQQSGHLLVEGAERAPNHYYGPGGQMHNKFILIDDYRVMTGSMNITETGIYGTYRNRMARVPGGNSNNLIELHSPEATSIYRAEFNQMWGSHTVIPDRSAARFRSEKPQNQSAHFVRMGDIDVRILFSPGYDVISEITAFVEEHALTSLYFCIFAWSDSRLENIVKQKWEGSPEAEEGSVTGFDLKGVFERIFWNQWWSANINMQGREAQRTSYLNPNIPWRNTPPVYRDRESRKLHHKYMLIDANTPHNPTVITGSANWSRNANEINDENTVFIHDARIVNQFVQEFYARFQQAGGQVRSGEAHAAR